MLLNLTSRQLARGLVRMPTVSAFWLLGFIIEPLFKAPTQTQSVRVQLYQLASFVEKEVRGYSQS